MTGLAVFVTCAFKAHLAYSSSDTGTGKATDPAKTQIQAKAISQAKTLVQPTLSCSIRHGSHASPWQFFCQIHSFSMNLKSLSNHNSSIHS